MIKEITFKTWLPLREEIVVSVQIICQTWPVIDGQEYSASLVVTDTKNQDISDLTEFEQNRLTLLALEILEKLDPEENL